MKNWRDSGTALSAAVMALIVIVYFPIVVSAAQDAGAKVDPSLANKLAEAQDGESFIVWVYFVDRPSTDADPDDGLPPVNSAYLQQIRSIPGVKARFVDELQNSISIAASWSAVLEVSRLPFVTTVEEVPMVEVLSHSHQSPSGDLNVAMNAMQIETLHHQGWDGTGVRIAVLDTGVKISHEALTAKSAGLIWKDFVNDLPTPYDGQGHGTRMAGLALGNTGGTGTDPDYKGAAYDASLMAIKVLDDTGSGTMDTVVEGIQFAVSNGADVISLSLGFRRDPFLQCITKDGKSSVAIWVGWAVSQGVPTAVAAGNEGADVDCGGSEIRTPGDNFNAITVGATTADGTDIWRDGGVRQSSGGPTQDGRIKPDLAAPGVGLKAPRHNDDADYTTSTGTSPATALTAGAIAVLLEEDPTLNPAQVKAALRQTGADRGPFGPDQVYGFGLLQATSAANAAIDMQFAWDDDFDVAIPFISFHVTDNSHLSLESVVLNGKQMLDVYDIPYVHSGGSGWIPLDNSILFAGPYVNEATATTLSFAAIYDTTAIRFTFLTQIIQLSAQRVEFRAHLDYVVTDQFELQVNARSYLDFDLHATPSNDYFEKLSNECNYNNEIRLTAVWVRVRETLNLLTAADIYYDTLDGFPWEWLLKYPGDRADPNSALNGEPIYNTNVVFQYESRRGVTANGRIGPTIFFDLNKPNGGGCSGGGGSPFVAPWNGTGYENDNNILPLSDVYDRESLDTVDHYRLSVPLVPKQGRYSLKLLEFEDEHSYVDSIELWAVEHDEGVRVYVHPKTGEVFTYEDPEAPTSAFDNYGRDVLGQLQAWDGSYYEAWRGDTLELNFGKVKQDQARLIVVADFPLPKTRIFVNVWNGTDWILAETMHHRINFSEDVIDLSAFILEDADLRVQLVAASRVALDQIGLDTSPPKTFALQGAMMLSAIHSSGQDVLSLLSSSDAEYAEIVPGQEILLEFDLPAMEDPDKERSFILVSEGHYQHRYQSYIGEDIEIDGRGVQLSAVLAATTAVYHWEVNITTLSWQMGDGTLREGASIAHTYEEAGEYTIRVTVQYEDGHSVTYERSVIVEG